MKHFYITLLRVFGYICFAIGCLSFVVGAFVGSFYLITLLFTRFQEVNAAYVGNLIHTIFWGFILGTVGTGILGRKKWGRVVAIIYLVYSVGFSGLSIKSYISTNQVITAVSLFKLLYILLFICEAIVLFILISPVGKNYFLQEK